MIFPAQPTYASARSPVMADNMVAASQPLAGQAGLSMLAQGGNAVDAAIATAITLTQVEPTGCGLGSDAFAIVWDGKQLHGLNASGRSAKAWTPDRFKAQGSVPDTGWETVTVPGAIAGWVELHAKLGKLPFEKLFEPAIKYASTGFSVTPIIGDQWRSGGELLKNEPGFSDHFLPNGKAPNPGERFVNPDAAATLIAIAESKGKAFYEGDIAQKIAQNAKQHGSALTVEDFAANKPDWCGTVSQKFDNISLHEIPPNGQGIAACMALGMLASTKVRDYQPDDPQALHLMIEAMKLAFRDSAQYVAELQYMSDVGVEELLNADYLAERAALIDPQRAQDFKSGSPKKGGTVCLSTADASGMMVSFIQSNYAGFGSGVVVPGTGVHLQNRACGFTTQAGHPNQVDGFKRPFHTIIPGFIMNDTGPVMAFGVMGGMMQAQGHVQMTLRTQLWGQDVQSAVDAPRWRVTEGLGVSVEEAMPDSIVQALKSMGHHVSVEKPDLAFGFGGAQLVHKLDSGGYAAGSDPRKDGGAYGF